MPDLNDPANQSLTPVPRDARAFATFDHFALWGSLGVGLLVMQVGALLIPALDPGSALVAIVLGSLIGAALLAWVGRLGCRTGLSSAGLITETMGRRFATLPIALNVVQLLGWATFELVIMRESSARLFSSEPQPWQEWLFTALWGGLLLALMFGNMIELVRRFLRRFGLTLVLLSLVWLTIQFAGKVAADGWSAFLQRPGTGAMSWGQALDLVIAMPISWLPLIADYARYGRSEGGVFRGTWAGYALANIWCYGLGVLIASSSPDTELLSALLMAQGGAIALGLILIDEVDNAYGDLHSGSVSLHGLKPHRSVRGWGVLLALAAIVLSLVLPMHSIEPFLLMLSSVFVPLFAVVVSHYTRGGEADPAAVHPQAVIAWITGVAAFHLISQFAPTWGAALPAFAFTWALHQVLLMAGRGAARSVDG